jgi:hypothetical protein
MIVPAKDELHMVVMQAFLDRMTQPLGRGMLSSHRVKRMMQEDELPHRRRFRQFLRQPLHLRVELPAAQL